MELLKIDKTDKSKVTLTIEVKESEFKSAFNVTLEKLKAEADFTEEQLEEIYKDEKYIKEAIDICYMNVSKFLASVLKKEDIMLAARPNVNYDLKEDGSVLFIITGILYPALTLKKYKGLEVCEVIPDIVDEDSINKELQQIAFELKEIKLVDRESKDGDIVTITLDDASEDFKIVLGKESFIPGLHQQLYGRKIDEVFEIKLNLPLEYGGKELSEDESVYMCKVNKVEEIILPEIDDEFAKQISDFDTLEELKVAVTKKQQSENKNNAINQFDESIIDELISNLEGEIPDDMIKEQLFKLVEDFMRTNKQSVEDSELPKLMGHLKPKAEKQVKSHLALKIVADKEKLVLTKEQYEAELNELSKQYNMGIEQIKQVVSEDTLKSDMLIKLALLFVIDNVIVIK